MKTIEKLKAALAAVPDEEWISTGVVVCTPVEGGMDYVLRGLHADGIKNDPYVELAALMHNTLPALIECVERLHAIVSIEGSTDFFALCDEARTALAKLENAR